MQKKRNKKLTAVILVLVMALSCFMGCAKNSIGSETPPSQNGTETETTSLSAKDMTVEEMLKHIKLYGEDVSLPCKVSELPKTVTLGDGYTFSEGGAVADLLHNGEKIGAAHFDEMESNEFKEINMSSGYEEEVITAFSLHAYADGVDCFEIVGIIGRDTQKDVLEKLGEPTIRGENDLTYESTHNGKLYGLTFLYDTDELMGLCIARITDERQEETTNE